MLGLDITEGEQRTVCKLIAELVGADKQIVSEVVHRLERASGAPGIDIRLTGEIYGRLHMKVRELGLDPNDTTANELYRSLLSLADLHDQFLAKRFGIQDCTNADEVISTVVGIINKLHMPRHAWVIKGSTIKKLLKATPPKQLMHDLRYRSLESMLKREPARLLLNIARHIESEKWHEKFDAQCAKLSPTDFEQRDIEVQYLDALKWSAIVQDIAAKRHTNIFYSPEAGNVVITPLPSRGAHGLTLATFMMVLHNINEIRTHSTYLKFHQLMPGFGQKIRDITTSQQSAHVHMAGQPVHWRIVHRYYGTTTRILHPEVFEPHIQPEDMAYRKAEHVLYRFEPALHFWHDLDYIGVSHPSGAISFNLMDVVLNLLNNVPYEQRLNYHLRDSLWNELLVRYVGQRSLERQLLQHLDEQTIAEPSFSADLEFVS